MGFRFDTSEKPTSVGESLVFENTKWRMGEAPDYLTSDEASFPHSQSFNAWLFTQEGDRYRRVTTAWPPSGICP